MLDPQNPPKRRESDKIKSQVIEAAKTIAVAVIAALAAYLTARR